MFAIALLLGQTRLLVAQTVNREGEAKQQFLSGQAAVKKGELEPARKLFQSSYDIVPAAGTLLNLADCEERLGLFASAREHFQKSAQILPSGDARIAFARGRAAALDSKVPVLRIDGTGALPVGARVLVDDREITTAGGSVDLPLDPGDHQVTVKATGHEDWRRRLSLAQSARKVVKVEVGEKTPPPEGTTPPPAKSNATPSASATTSPSSALPPADAAATARSRWRIAGWTSGAAGLVGLAVGVGTGIIAVQRKTELETLCPVPAHCNADGAALAREGEQMAALSTAGIVAGLAMTTGGVLFLVLGRDVAPVKVNAAAAPTGASLSVQGSF